MLYLRSKLHNQKLKTKIRTSFIVLTVISIFAVTILSYTIASRELLRESEQTVAELERQGMERLLERKKEFEESSFRILQMSNLEPLLHYSPEEAIKLKTRNEGLPSAVMQQSLLNKFTEYALLMPTSGVIYDYYPGGAEREREETERELLELLDAKVDRHRPLYWGRVDGKDFFARQIISPVNLEEQGILLFCVKEDFFQFIGDSIFYLDSDSDLVIDQEGNFLKGENTSHAEDILSFLSDKGFERDTQLTGSDENIRISLRWSKDSGWFTAVCFSTDVLLAGMRRMLRYAVLITVAALIIGIVLTELLSRTIAANTAVIESGMQEFEQGNFRYRIHPTSYDEVGLLGLQLNYMANRIENLMERQKAYEENKRQLELETLQAQINPHFLYNTLGSLKWLAVRGGNKVIASSLDALVKLLRFTIKRAAGMVTVSEEIDYIKSYADIEKMRYDDGFDIEYEVSEDVLNEEIPGFILQPLIENSLLHGLDMTLDDAFIYVRARYQTDNGELFLLIEEEDNGIGMDEETLLSLQSENRPKKNGFSSIGVSIVSKRLKEIYGDRFHMDIVSSPMQGTRICLWIPRDTAGQSEKPHR